MRLKPGLPGVGMATFPDGRDISGNMRDVDGRGIADPGAFEMPDHFSTRC